MCSTSETDCANGLRTVEKKFQFHRRRNLLAELRQHFLMLSTTSTVFAPGWRCMASTMARVLLYQLATLLFCTLSARFPIPATARDFRCDTRQSSDGNLPHFQLAGGLHGERLMFAVKCAERLIHVALRPPARPAQFPGRKPRVCSDPPGRARRIAASRRRRPARRR